MRRQKASRKEGLIHICAMYLNGFIRATKAKMRQQNRNSTSHKRSKLLQSTHSAYIQIRRIWFGHIICAIFLWIARKIHRGRWRKNCWISMTHGTRDILCCVHRRHSFKSSRSVCVCVLRPNVDANCGTISTHTYKNTTTNILCSSASSSSMGIVSTRSSWFARRPEREIARRRAIKLVRAMRGGRAHQYIYYHQQGALYICLWRLWCALFAFARALVIPHGHIYRLKLSSLLFGTTKTLCSQAICAIHSTVNALFRNDM